MTTTIFVTCFVASGIFLALMVWNAFAKRPARAWRPRRGGLPSGSREWPSERRLLAAMPARRSWLVNMRAARFRRHGTLREPVARAHGAGRPRSSPEWLRRAGRG